MTSASAPPRSGMGGRKMIKAAAALITIGYCSLLAYQGRVAFNFQESRPETVQVLLEFENNQTNDIVTPVYDVAKAKVVESERTNKNKTYDITLDDIFISVKTSKQFQFTRLPIILMTWFQLAKNQTWFFTDTNNPQLQNQTNKHMVNTKCSTTHERKALCCKMSVEYDYFISSDKKWFCHFDDDNYVNIPRLLEVLKTYNPQKHWYLGRTSIYKPVKVMQMIKGFWFATGGAGFCMSRSLALKIVPYTSGGRFISVCEDIRLPDDVAMAYVIRYYGEQSLTIVPEFHSHYEQLNTISSDTFRDQISFSYSRPTKANKEWNVVNVPGFSSWYDPSRFLSLHCFLFPHYEFCPR